MAVIEAESLRKEFRGLRRAPTIAVDGLDLSVPEGGVFGFLGPNGSGKTTTIRCLLGLVRPTSGRCRLLGADSQNGLAGVIRRVGSIVEAPTLFPGFSGRRNLLLLGRLYGIGPHRVDAVLTQVGLASRARDRVRTYSLGMKQRLGIAAALLRDPAVLILDEPANGLDPAGIKEVRDLLRRLGDEGRTVFLSSHLLGEVEQVCDRVAILAQGRRIAGGSVEEVLAHSSAAGLEVRLDDVQKGQAALSEAGLPASADGDIIRVAVPVGEAARVTKALADRGLYLTELRPATVTLESVFLELTGASPPPPPPAASGPSSPPPSPPHRAD
jgi:ABC-2 type transport system ATP-binding protein